MVTTKLYHTSDALNPWYGPHSQCHESETNRPNPKSTQLLGYFIQFERLKERKSQCRVFILSTEVWLVRLHTQGHWDHTTHSLKLYTTLVWVFWFFWWWWFCLQQLDYPSLSPYSFLRLQPLHLLPCHVYPYSTLLPFTSIQHLEI